MIDVRLYADDCREFNFWSVYIAKHGGIAACDLSIHADYKSPLNSTGKNLRNKAKRLGYYCKTLSIAERNGLIDDIFAINTSVLNRQGREMSASYLEKPKPMSEGGNCTKHYGKWFGVFSRSGKLVGYIVGSYCGDIAASSMILGHGDYLRDGVMYLIYDYFMSWCFANNHKVIVYSRWSDGTDGLRTFKHNIGMSSNDLRAV